MIKAGSFSRLKVFETCKKRAELQFVHKIKEPERGDPMETIGKAEWPNDRGSRIHDESEAFVKGERDEIPHEAKSFERELQRARALFAEDKVYTEEMWCFDDDWMAVPWNAWDEIRFRVKTDLTVFLTPEIAVIADYKTGRSYGNEADHAAQLQLYALGAALMFPDLKQITTEVWYFDEDKLTSMEFTATQARRSFKNWNDRNLAMQACVDFPANPSKNTCRWCPYSPRNSGDCSVGVV